VPQTITRRAGSDDSARLSRIASATFALACPPGTTLEAIDHFILTHFTETHFAGHLADTRRDLLIVSVDGEPVGYSMSVAEQPTDPDVASVVTASPAVELSKFYLLETAHGSGAAGVLMADTLRAASERGAAVVWLGVNQHNARANRFYEKNGFEVVGMKRFLVGEKYEDDFVRALTLRD
jgi:ribosomal protein S18 acetylase RimI-like enzyme